MSDGATKVYALSPEARRLILAFRAWALTQGLSVKIERAAEASKAEPAPAQTCAAKLVFEHYVALHPRVAWTDARRTLIERRMKEGRTPAELIRALDGYHASPWHRGENDRNRPYLDLELLLRDAGHVERGLALHEEARRAISRANGQAIERPAAPPRAAAPFDARGRAV